ncbi:MAG: hypothetical protein HYR85_28015 [Planctomycetes bacterium]|nr:hypothetical protein [Planctomycetota bacterium]MBI3845292.1 hypothetical protein [Planctomycetota bacterium]
MRKSLEKGYENNKVAAKSELNQWLRETNARQEAMPSAKPAERLLDGVSPPGRRFDSALEQVVALYETGDFVGAATLARRWIDEDPTDKARVEILGRMAGVAIRHVNGFHSQAADELLAAEKHGTDAARQAADGSFGGLMKAKEMASWVWDKRRKSVGSVTLPAAATTPVSHTIVDWSATTRRILDAPLSPSTELAVREIRAANADKERAQAALGRLDSSDENQRPEIAKQNQVIVHATAKQATVVLALPHFTSWGIGTDGTPAAEKKDHSGTSTTNGHE